MRPKSINLFEILGLSAAGLGILSAIVMLIQIVGLRPGPGFAVFLLLIFVILLFVALAVAAYYAARRRHDAGRWGFVVAAAVVAVLLLTRLDGLGRDGMAVLFLVLDLLTLGALMGAAVALLQPDASAWFAQGPIRLPPRPIAQPPFPGYGGPVAGAAYPPATGFPPAPAYPPATPPQPAALDSLGPAAAYPPVASHGPAPVAAEATRRCPYCAEEIRAEATKCRFCGSAVEPLVS